jgi:hypothetical protein
MLMQRWATRDLHNGDLTALRSVARGSAIARENQIKRLRRRGFVAERSDGTPAITMHGRVALLLKKFKVQA